MTWKVYIYKYKFTYIIYMYTSRIYTLTLSIFVISVYFYYNSFLRIVFHKFSNEQNIADIREETTLQFLT